MESKSLWTDSRALWDRWSHQLSSWAPGLGETEVESETEPVSDWELNLADQEQLERAVAELFAEAIPDPTFRINLKQALLQEHANQQRRFSLPDWGDEGLSWQMAATVPVVVGILAFLWRRNQRSPG